MHEQCFRRKKGKVTEECLQVFLEVKEKSSWAPAHARRRGVTREFSKAKHCNFSSDHTEQLYQTVHRILSSLIQFYGHFLHRDTNKQHSNSKCPAPPPPPPPPTA